MALTARQQRFVDEYLIDLNATQAAIRAGYSAKTANRMGAENLSKPGIQAEIQRSIKDRERRTNITQDRVVQELAKVGFFNPSALVDEVGNPLPLHKLSKDALASISVEAGVDGVKVKQLNKITALQELLKHTTAKESASTVDTESAVTIYLPDNGRD